jgi:hypothetical protein
LDIAWEYLYNPELNRFLALSSETPIVRYLHMPEYVTPLAVEPPLRVLVIISSPAGYETLDGKSEWSKLNQALANLRSRGLVVLKQLQVPTLEALLRELRRAEYHVIHFVGHGGYDRQTDDGVIVLEDERGQASLASGQELGVLLHDHRSLRLVLLNACEGARASIRDPFSGTAQSLVQQGIPAVIAMQFRISDEAAITYAGEFYAALADSYPVDAALAEARKVMFVRRKDTEWGTPVLYTRSPDGCLFSVEGKAGDQAGPAQYSQDEPGSTSGFTAQPEHVSLIADETADEQPSPFIAGPPITDPRFFFGRERELRRILNLCRHTPLQNAAIVGPRRSGKTSLLRQIVNLATMPPERLRPEQRVGWLSRRQHYHWIYVDFQDPRLGTRSGLLHHLLSSLDIVAPQPCDLERCIDVLSDRLDSPTVVLMDEIGVALQRYDELDDPFWEGLRALASNLVDGRLGFVLASDRPPDQLAQHSDLGSPFFNIFGYTAALGPLRESAARALIASSPLPFRQADVKWIMSQSHRWPILLQILCRERLFSLEEGDTGDSWREGALRQMFPFRHLLTAS